MKYKHFTNNGNYFQSNRIGYFSLLLSIFWGCITLMLLYEGFITGDYFKNWYWIITILITAITLRLYAQQVIIDMTSGKITKSYFGLLRKEIKISDIRSFETLKHYTSGIPNGTDIIIHTADNKPLKVYEKIGKTKNVESILNEIKQIINLQ